MANVWDETNRDLGPTMRDTQPSPSSVVVGIDGSRNSLTAALWAVDEAIARDIPLRLVYAIDAEHTATNAEESARVLAKAETAVRMAFMAIESTNKPVKIEVEILQGRPTDVMLQAARAAEMICVGPIGLKNAAAGRIGSTAAALASRARCPVAIVRGYDPLVKTGSVVAEVDSSPDSDAVLERGIKEALLRNAPLVVISAWQTKGGDVFDAQAVAERNQQVRAELSRRLAHCTRQHPELDVTPVAAHGSLLTYLSRHAQSTQLVVVGRRRAHGIAEMVGPPCYAALRDSDCSVLVCAPPNPL
ncbi:universal stress protein [soil metagenome]